MVVPGAAARPDTVGMHDGPLLAACPRCDLPMVLTAPRRVVRCSCCGTLTPRRRLIALAPPAPPRRRRRLLRRASAGD
jgi:hypothetical protein